MAAKKYKWKGEKTAVHSISQKKHEQNLAAKRKAAPAQRVTMADRIRLGEDAAAVKASTSPKDWKQIVKTAHAKGWTVASALSNVPDPLKQRTTSSLKTQAMKNISEAYAPEAKVWDEEQQQADNIRQRRMADEQKFSNWQAQQMSSIAGAAMAAQSRYQDFVDKQSGEVEKAGQRLAQQAVDKASQGALGDISQAQSVESLKQRGEAEAAQARNQAAAAAAGGPSVAASMAALQTSIVQGGAAQRRNFYETEWGKATADVKKGRLDMVARRAKDTITEYTRLLDKEMDKANANRDYTALQQQISQKAKSAEQEHREFLIGQRTTRRGQDIGARTTRRGQDIGARTARRGQNLSHADRVADRAARKSEGALSRALTRSEGAANRATTQRQTAATNAKNNADIMAPVETIASILRTQQKNGKLWDPDAKKWLPSRQALIRRGATDAQINAAVAHARGKLLTPGQKRALGYVG